MSRTVEGALPTVPRTLGHQDECASANRDRKESQKGSLLRAEPEPSGWPWVLSDRLAAAKHKPKTLGWEADTGQKTWRLTLYS